MIDMCSLDENLEVHFKLFVTLDVDNLDINLDYSRAVVDYCIIFQKQNRSKKHYR
jgi:hypothetical protein